jgi:ElaB/YqjD/DUF883 family membrane-anchored ribosome-binding protein
LRTFDIRLPFGCCPAVVVRDCPANGRLDELFRQDARARENEESRRAREHRGEGGVHVAVPAVVRNGRPLSRNRTKRRIEMADRAAASARTIEEDIAALREDLKALSSNVAGLAKEKGESLRAGLESQADRVAASGREAAETVQDAVRERPMTSVFVAFGVGVLIGHLLDRR